MKRVITASSNSKLLSVFWYDGNNFIGPEATLQSDEVEAYGPFLQLPVDHFQIWYRYNKELEYDYYPRGRVIFNSKLHKFIVIGDKKLCENEEVKAKIRKHYGLPVTTIFETDEHYQSKANL